jgi:gliding motility-associated-like protein
MMRYHNTAVNNLFIAIYDLLRTILLLKLQTMKNSNSLRKAVVVLIAFTFSFSSLANDYYWVNGSGDWDDPSHWSLSSGGSAAGLTPGANDNVVFDQNSSAQQYAQIELANSVSIKNIVFNSPNLIGIVGKNSDLSVSGNFLSTEKFILNVNNLNLQGTGQHNLSAFGGEISSNINFNNGTWNLLSPLETSRIQSINFNTGALFSNGFSIVSESIYANSNPYSFNLTGSTIFAYNVIDFSQSQNIGGAASFIAVDNEILSFQQGGFVLSASTFERDQNYDCDATGLFVDVVSLDYVGGVQVSCDLVCDGQITLTPSGTPGPFSFAVDGPPFTSQTVYTGLCQGNRLIQVRDSSQIVAPGPIYYVCTFQEFLNNPSTISIDLTAATPNDVSCYGVCDGQAFTTANGGTTPFSVTWATSGEITTSPIALCAGVNDVSFVDANGCTVDTTMNIGGPPIIDATLTITEPICNGDSNGEVLVAPFGGNGGGYTFSWNPIPTSGQGTNPGIGFSGGAITLSIFDVDNCQRDTTFNMTEPTILTISANPLADATCFGLCDGQANSTPVGGAGGNTFEWFTCPKPGVTTSITVEDPNTLCAGDYYVVVTDQGGAGCTAESPCITINEPIEIDAQAQVYQMSCFGVCDGAVDVDATGGVPFVLPPPADYNYSWVTVPGGAGVGATDSLSGLCSGFYEVIVTDANGCTSSPDTVEVVEPPQLTLSIVGTDPTCYDLCDGSAVATPAGGSPGYNFVWSPAPGAGQGTATPTGLCATTYTLDITDSQGCPLQDQVILNAPPVYDITSNQTNLQCAGDSNGTIDIIVNSGGTGAGYTYNWVPAPAAGQGTPNVSSLTAGVWCVTVTDPLACDTTICFTITEPSLLTATASVISQVTCFGDCNGSAQVVIVGGSPLYNIVWNPGGQTSLVANNLCAGAYTVTVTDANGCVANDNVNIIEPAQFDLNTSQVDLICNGICSGSATVTMNSGGTAPYVYLWDDAPVFQNTPTAINLCAGNYTVTVTDQNLCDTIIPYTIIEPPLIVIDTNVTNFACFGTCSGAANITVVGGTGAYTFEWFDVLTGLPLGVNNDSISNLCPGQYYAQVTDAALCVINSDTITITELPEIFSSVVSSTDATCGLCDGLATVTASGGTGTFTFVWTPAPGAGQGTASATGLCAGVYNVVATDQAGCTTNIAVNINSVALEVTTMDSTNISCFGLCDGQVEISYTVLDPPYTVQWFDALTGLPVGAIDGPPASNPSTASFLCAGTYLAVLTNQSGCVTSDSVSIIEPPEITGIINATQVTCNGICNGAATIVAGGGTPGVGGYTYVWNPLPGAGQGTATVSGLCAGNWDVTVFDSLNCNNNFQTTISEPVLLVIISEPFTPITCFGANDGTATVLHSGGIGPYTYEWFDCNSGLPIGQTTQSATNLGPGAYQVVVTDANSCTATSTCVQIIEPTGITATLNISPVNCFGSCDGMIDVVPVGGTAPYFYQWQDEFFVDIAGQTNDTINNVCQGVYNVVITDFNNCAQTFGPADMTSPINPWNVAESQTNVTCAAGCDGTATVNVLSGNTPPYTYQWDDVPLFQITPTATNLCAGVYNVTISDAGICDTVITFTIIDANPIIANANITNVLCNGNCTGQIDLTPSGGNPPYTVTWSDFQVGDTAFALCAGAIIATITDASGCPKDTTINITEPPLLSLTSSFSNNPTCGVCNGSATVNVNGGTPGYTFVWSPAPGAGQGTNNATGLCSGVTSATVTDLNGCVLVEVFPLSDINAEILTMDSTDVSCFGVCDGAAEVLYVCGDPACTNQWFDGITGLPIAGETNTTIAALCAGDYYVEVINASGCVSVGLTTVTGPTQIIANEAITQIVCGGASDGTITLAPTGGSGAGYSFLWTPVPGNGQGVNPATGLGGGNWCVDITDSDNCTQSYCYNLVDPTPIVITPTVTDPLCNGDCNGFITVSVTGGNGAYTYQWLDGGGIPIVGEINPLISGLCTGNYTVEVTDAGGCVQALLITLTEPSAVTSPIAGTNITCFGACDGTATVTPAGGFPPYVVNWYNNTTGLLIGQSGTSAANLCPEFYHAVITDNNGCNFQTLPFEITEPAQLTWNIVPNDASCFGVCDGDATITPLGGTPAYTYTWLDITGTPIVGGTNPNVINLCAGNYTVEVVDANGCTSGPQAVVINEFPQITASVFTNNATCGVADGNATVNAAGGNPPYSYQWMDNLLNPLVGETNNILLNVFSGTYFVDVTDLNGCTETFQADISDNSSTTLIWDAVNNPLCFGGADGSIQITTTTANPPLAYTWNPGGLIAEDPTGLTAGVWTLQTTDATGCINFYDTLLVDPAELIVTSSATPSDCGQCNGTADIVITGGTGTISIIWNTSATTTSLTGLCASTYEAQVTDQNGCLVIEQVEVPNNGGLTGSQAVTAITCAGSCDGAVTVSGVGGAPPYSYLWLHNNSILDTETNLCAGSYFVTITDAVGCTYSIEVTMSDPPAITDNPTVANPACGLADGSITVLTSGGILPHTYSWNPGGAVTPSITGLSAGIYTLTVTDAANCTQDFVYGLSNSNAPVATLMATNANCATVCDGFIDTTSVIGGTPIYSYQWLDAAGSPIGGETNPLLTGQCAGDFMLEITDAASCISYVNATITEPDTILLNPIFAMNPSCNGICDGELISNPIGGTLPFSFIWDDTPPSTTFNADSLCDGSYNVIITDANGCTANQAGTVVEPLVIGVTTDSIIDATCLNSPDGEIYITSTGGTPGYTYQWVSQTAIDTFTLEDPTGLLPMDYYLTVTDTNGCQFLDTMTVDTLLVVLVDAGLDTLLCFGGGAALIATSNTANIDFTWFDTTGTNLSDTNTYIVPSSVIAGVEYYVVTGTFGVCTHSDTVIVTTAVSFTADAGPDIQLFSNQTGTIGGSPTSNDLTHVYLWTPAQFLSDTTIANPDVIQPQSSSWYYVTATDTNGCTAIDSMFVEVKPDIIIPNGISPDGNGLNDTWILDFLQLYPGVPVKIGVYNRWGEPIYAANENYQDDWGGTTSDGKRLPAGTYYYTIEIDHPDFPDPFTGPITIMW